MHYFIYNPKSNKGKALKRIEKIYKKLSKKYITYKINLLEISGKEESFVLQCNENDILVLCGGDGTINRFVNGVKNIDFKCKIYLYKCGTGNDFAREFKRKYFDITDYIKNLPDVIVNGNELYKSVNGVGIGIDAAVCRSKQQYKFAEVKKSYFKISLECVKTFRPYSLEVEVDGEKRIYNDVWFFVCNNGRYMGGGMKVVPKASRLDDELDVCIVHSVSKFKLVCIFPLIYLGWHVLFKKYVDYFKCKTFKARAIGCNIMQNDGEVLEYVENVSVSF